MIQESFRPAVAELSKNALLFNLGIVQQRANQKTSLHQKNSKIMAVVKANAYGHGAAQVLPVFLKEQIQYFCVASVEEGIELRRVSEKPKILVLGGSLQWSKALVDIVKKYKLEVAVNDMKSLRLFLNEPKIPFHLKFDTGMNRLGIKSEDWGQAIELLKTGARNCTGVFTHYASFEGVSFLNQIRQFEELVRWMNQEKLLPKWVHSENSGALFSKEKRIKKGILSEVSNLVRPGISLYGYLPSNFKKPPLLKPVLSLVSEVGIVKEVKTGEGISYDHLYRAKKKHAYAVVSMGYADGLSKSYGNLLRPEIWRKGRRIGQAEICGAICMDMVMVKSASARLNVGDKIVFWGNQANPLLKMKMADPYELNLRISKRIPRIWKK